MLFKRVAIMLLLLALLASGFLSLDKAAASQHQDEQATVTVLLWDSGLEFGGLTQWEAALYSGTQAGQETEGRITEWMMVENGEVTFNLPDDILTGMETPWDEENNTYVRVRLSEAVDYPVLDMVSDPFTLEQTDHWVLFSFQSMNAFENTLETGAEITLHLIDLGGDFGQVQAWEASLYTGPQVGQETEGRFTEWVTVTNEMITITLPDDLLAGETSPWNEAVYFRVRSVADDYPGFDLVSRPFILVENDLVTTHMIVYRGMVEALIVVDLEDMGEDFGAVGDWEASLYTGQEPDQELEGRFTAWVMAANNQAIIALPLDLSNESAPWEEEVYLRIRTLENEYPQFDLISMPFVLTGGHHRFVFSLHSENTEYMAENTEIRVNLQDLSGEFGALAVWEASLYLGAVPGDETEGRFTEWMSLENEGVVFTLPDDVLEGEMPPWGENIYVRLRSLAEDYPVLDMVALPFMLVEGQSMETTITLIRGQVELEVEDEFVVYLPLLMQEAFPAEQAD